MAEGDESHCAINKKVSPGIVYLNYIPPLMNVKRVRKIFSEFGEVGRLFLQPDKNKKQGKLPRYFTEGWVEFKNKKVAKRVARHLNGAQVGGRRRDPYYDSLWSIKYLCKFRWAHLSEQLAYQKAMRNQRMRAEISQAKREANFYIKAAEKRSNKIIL